MPFRRLRSTLIYFAAFISLVACGEKKPAERALLPGKDSGCYDKLGDRVTRFFEGTIDNAEWNDTFDCVNDQVTFFKKYVRGNDPKGYTQADIAALIRQFLITSKPLSDSFIASIFEIKGSVFGGSTTVISPQEIDEFLKLSEVLRTETTKLLPALQAKHRSPSGPNLLNLSDSMSAFGANLSGYLKTLKGTVDVRKESYLPFVRELIELHGGDPAVVEKYGDFVRNMKVVATGGKVDVIEASMWAPLVQQGAAFGGILLAYRDMEFAFTGIGEKDQFQIDLSRRLQSVINHAIALHGGKIALERFDPVIDTIPAEALSKEKREAIKHDLRPMVMRAMKGGVPGYLNTAAVATVFDLFEAGTRRQIHLKKIYATLGPSPSKSEFEAGARKYLSRVSSSRARAEVDALIDLSNRYVGLFPDGSDEMVFRKEIREIRSQNHMERMSWFNVLIQHVFSVYATGTAGPDGKRLAQTSDLADLTTDFNHILIQWKLSAPDLTAMQMALKRFREANLFMPVSNGDAFMDEAEGTYYLAFLFSSSSLSKRIFDGVTENAPGWSACPITGKDDLNQDAVDADCFRRVYFGHPEVFWNQFPGLQAEYANLTPDERADLAKSMEIAARRGGYSDKPIGPYDTDSLAALPHYVEDIVAVFDKNSDEVLDKREILDDAYPVFRKVLSDAAPKAAKNSDFLLKGILTYIVKYGREPSGTLDLLAWCARLPFTKVEADRSALYRVVAIIASAPAAGNASTSTSWPELFPTVSPQ